MSLARGEAEPEDLSGNLIVQLSRATEELNRGWYERNTARQVRDVQREIGDVRRFETQKRHTTHSLVGLDW
jgi:hypothetical protein